ncbi:MAG: tRNA preQ1(34) S-adenosylmethionine ribosyltransferase-isomerase QueA [Acidobacteriota bacterium]
MLTRDFDFDLPEELIAQHPVPRGSSRLLVVDPPGDRPAPEGRMDGLPQIHHQSIRDLPQLLDPGDLLVVNDTRVIPARLFAHREPGGGRVELLLAEKLDELTWEVLLKPGRKTPPGTRLRLPYLAGSFAADSAAGEEAPKPPADIHRPANIRLRAQVLALGVDGRRIVRFSQPIENHWEELGHMPLPPYVKRPDSPEDRRRYQTVWAQQDGAIAAPTAGLHFDSDLLEALEKRGVQRASVTLHVGLGTFKPVTAELVHEHRMDAERWILPHSTAGAIAETRARGRRVIAVGTTVVRTLESAALAAHREPNPSQALLGGEGRSELFITPGFRFRVVDRLLTNFHLPRSTLLMLVSALAGQQRILQSYAEAIAHRYRFYSYGDAMLLTRASRD